MSILRWAQTTLPDGRVIALRQDADKWFVLLGNRTVKFSVVEWAALQNLRMAVEDVEDEG